jgi:hypothetical protein
MGLFLDVLLLILELVVQLFEFGFLLLQVCSFFLDLLELMDDIFVHLVQLLFMVHSSRVHLCHLLKGVKVGEISRADAHGEARGILCLPTSVWLLV